MAQYGPGDKKDLPADQYGPLFILGNGLAAFFVLAFLAARGGLAARLAGIAGLIIDVALLMKSAAHIDVIAAQYAAPRRYVPEQLSGSYASGQASVMSPALAYDEANRTSAAAPKGASARQAMAYARKHLRDHGLSVGQWPELVTLWNMESGWRHNAVNPQSGAYGIPQALPKSKLPKAAQAGDYRSQIDWGLSYIRQRYGSIGAALAHEIHFGWY